MRFIRQIFTLGNGNGRRPGAGPILTEEEFRAILLHECARCDRNGQRFSLIQVDLEAIGAAGEERRFTRKVIRRMRITDEIGWLSPRSIGIFLPEATREGARRFAEEVCGHRGYQIFHYPLGAGDSKSPRRDGGARSPGNGDRDEFFDHSAGRVPDSSIQLMTGLGMAHRPGMDGNGSGGRDAAPNHENLRELLWPQGLPLWKRAADVAGAAFLLLLLSPLFLAVAAFIKIVSPGPVLFVQQRVGYLGRSFPMLKFRSMKVSSDQGVHKDHLKKIIRGDGKLEKLDADKDDRFIPLAGLLRKTCIDELPQLFNVLRGEMSLVGPRPCLDYEAEEFATWQHRRFDTVPGMTGLWQVSGKSRTTFTDMVRLDVRYSRKKSPGMDLGIFLNTPQAIVKEAVGMLAAKRVRSSPERQAGLARDVTRAFNSLVRQIFL